MDANKENKKPCKKLRNPKIHKHRINKERREKGLEYQTIKGKTVPANKFQKIICKCPKSCHLTVNEDEQKAIFETFYGLNTWAQKTSFILNCVESSEIKIRRKPNARKNIQFKKYFHRDFGNKEKMVCKTFFAKVLQIILA